MKPEVMYEGIDLDTATERVQGILRHNGPGQLDEFKLPEVPAAVQEAGDKQWADGALKARQIGRRLATRHGAVGSRAMDQARQRHGPFLWPRIAWAQQEPQ